MKLDQTTSMLPPTGDHEALQSLSEQDSEKSNTNAYTADSLLQKVVVLVQYECCVCHVDGVISLPIACQIKTVLTPTCQICYSLPSCSPQFRCCP